jgi:hypothetical protein
MISGIHVKMFKPQPVIGSRQQVAARTDWVISKRLAKMVTLILCISLFIVFAFGQLMHWQITSTVEKLEQLRAVRSEYGSEHVGLLSARAQLASREHVVEVAGKKFNLFVPADDQVKRL